MNANKTITANFAINTYSLTVNATHGSVAKNPDAGSYDSATTVQLTATPATGYHFVNWTGDASGSTNPLTVTMDANKSITANFAVTTYSLTVNATHGSVAKNPDAGSYDSATTVQLTATPATGYHFTGWSGDASGSTNPLTVTMNANKTITATFAINTYTLSVNATNGSVAKNPDAGSYDSASTVQLTATPSTGYHFVNWSGDASGSVNPLSVTMNANKTITANFAITTYTLTVNATHGSIAKNPDQGSYDSASTVQLTATPSAGYHFTGWSGDASGSTNPLSVTVNANKSITANFAINTYTLSVTATHGSVAKNPDAGSYDSATTVQLTATPATGYQFVNWSGDASGSSNPLTVTMNANKSITANFAINTYTLSVTATHGSVAKNPDAASYDSAATVQLTATPSTGYHFVNWSGDASGSANPLSVTMNANKSITANFAINTFTLTVSATNGSVAKNPNQASYDSAASVQLTATPSTGYHFVNWSGDASGSANPFTVTMNANKSITANFAINTYTLSVTATNGSVTKNPDAASYDSATTVQMTATPSTGYHFVNWTGSASGSANPLTVTMDANKSITANFAVTTYTLTVNATHGSVAKNPDQTSYDSASTVQLTATPSAGYHFTGWSGDASGSANPLSVTMNGNKTITANFAINTYTLSVSATNGSVAKNPDQASYDSASTVQLTATPSTGYHFVNWTGSASGSVNPLTVTMDANKSITANFAVTTYTLTVNATHGSVAKNPDQASYDSASTVQLTATPSTGYHFVNWTGSASGSVNPLSVTMNGNKTITANFAINTYTLSVSATNGSVAKNPDAASYDSATTVQLTATPATGYHFVNWTGSASGSANPLSVTMDANKTITANFAINTFTLSVSATHGSVAKNPDQASYDSATTVQLTATPSTGYHFVNWTGSATGSTNPLSVTMNANKTIIANFAINTYTLTVNATHGSVVRNPNQASYDSATTVQLTATPSAGYHFVNWTGSASGSVNPLSVTMDANKTIAANFAVNPPSGATSQITASLTSITANGTDSTLITVQLKDAAGNNLPAGGDTVLLNTSLGTLGIVTDHGDGTYSAALKSGTVAANATIRGTANGSEIADTAAVTFTPGIANKLAFVQQPTNAIVGAALSPAPSIQLKDQYGNNVPSSGVTVKIGLSYGSGMLTGTDSVLTNGSGLATLAGLNIDSSGRKVFTATSTGLTSSVSDTFTIRPLRFSAKVYLQGPYNTGTGLMNTTLRSGGILASHFGSMPIPVTAVDSIYIEIRDSALTAQATVRRYAAAWLTSDGTIRSFSDTSKAYAELNAPIGSYYIVVRHRNHLAIMSAGKIVFTTDSTGFNFTTAQTQAYGSASIPMADLGGGTKFGMFAGDVTGNGQIKYSGSGNDRGNILARIGGANFSATVNGYYPEDTNLNGQVKYSGSGNDRGIILTNVGGANFSATKSTTVPQ
jgi:uncharacterized repeat protein (TIGR02543 family)